MKNIILKICVILTLLNVFCIYGMVPLSKADIPVTVTEKIPGADCTPDKKNKTLYKCTIKPGFGTVIEFMQKIITSFVLLAGLGGALFIVINGIMYSMGGADPALKDESKKRIIQGLIGIVLLLLSGVILNLIAPWVWVW